MAGASGRQRVHESCFTFFLVKVPPQDLRKRFSEIIAPIFSEIRILSLQIINLSDTRDRLLPRLISGKLSVENLDIQFPPGMKEM
jgi:type I restriction enzyme S subunit